MNEKRRDEDRENTGKQETQEEKNFEKNEKIDFKLHLNIQLVS